MEGCDIMVVWCSMVEWCDVAWCGCVGGVI